MRCASIGRSYSLSPHIWSKGSPGILTCPPPPFDQNAYTARWFHGPYLSLAFSIVLCFSRLGSSVNFIVTPMLADSGVPASIWVGAVMCLLSFIACLVLTALDVKGNSRVKVRAVFRTWPCLWRNFGERSNF